MMASARKMLAFVLESLESADARCICPPISAISELPYLVMGGGGGGVKKSLNGKKGHDVWDFSLAYPLEWTENLLDRPS